MTSLPVGGPLFGYAHFDMDAREVGRFLADLLENHLAPAALVIVLQFDLDLADIVDRHAALIVQRLSSVRRTWHRRI